MKKMSSNNTKKKKKKDLTREKMSSFPQAHIIYTKYLKKKNNNIKTND